MKTSNSADSHGFLSTFRVQLEHKWPSNSPKGKALRTVPLLILGVLQFYLLFAGQATSMLSISITICIFTLLYMFYNTDEFRYGGQYEKDPFIVLKATKDTIVLNKDEIAIDRVKTVVLNELEDVGYLSFIYNQVNGKPPTVYFDKVHLPAVRAFLEKHISPLEYIE